MADMDLAAVSAANFHLNMGRTAPDSHGHNTATQNNANSAGGAAMHKTGFTPGKYSYSCTLNDCFDRKRHSQTQLTVDVDQ